MVKLKLKQNCRKGVEYLDIIHEKKIGKNAYFKEILAYLCVFFLISKYYIDIILKGLHSPMPKMFLLGALACAVILLGIKVLSKQVYKIEVFIGSIFIIQFLITGNTLFLIAYIFSMALGQVEFRKIMKCYFLVSLSYFLSMIILGDKGLIIIGYMGVRSDLGFKNPNTAFFSFFMVWSSFLYLYLKSKECKSSEQKLAYSELKLDLFKDLGIVILCIFPLIVYSETKTRTGLLTVALIFMFIIMIKFLEKKNISLKFLEYIPQLFTLGSVGLALLFGNNWITNKFLSDRPKYWDMYLTHWKYGLNLQGYDNNIRDIVFSERIPLDSGYVFGLYVGGLIIFIIFIKMLSLSIRQLIKEEKIAEIVFMVSILIYSFAETILLDVNTNPALILVFYYAFKNWEEMKKLNNIK